jgi:hypothetical protein
LCRRIDRQYKQNIPKLATITDGLCAVSIFQRVEKKLQHFATITNGYTDGLVLVVILPRVEKKLQPLP